MTENDMVSESRRLRILPAVPAAVIVVLGTATAVLLGCVVVPAWMLFVIGIGAIDAYWIWSLYRRGQLAARPMAEDAADAGFSAPGYHVEVDCRGCGQFNRVPGHRLRERPKCGRCKARLMPGKRVVLCRVTSSLMKGSLRDELDAVWTDEENLWHCLADHVAIDGKAKAEAKNPSLRVVN